MQRSRPAVALLVETSNGYARGLVEGITTFVHEHAHWSIYLPEQQRTAAAPNWLRTWNGAGVIARIETEAMARELAKLTVPIIDLSAARLLPELPWVETDDRAIAVMAADHLLQRGFRHLAFCGEGDFNWSRWRCDHFESRVIEAGATCHIYRPLSSDRKASWPQQAKRIAQWLLELPKPVGVMACYDIKAQQLLDVCRELEISVPEQVAVIGVDNDQLLCNLCDPPLSSVIPDARRTGYLAAQLLDRAIRGEVLSNKPNLIQPLGVATRQSTDILAIDDPDIAKAMRMIRLQACSGLDVKQLLREIPLSRRQLEVRFAKLLGVTPHQAIVQQRLERVRTLLRETDLSLQQIAERAGFEHAEYLSAVFRKHYKQPPGAYRRGEAQ